MYIWAVFSEYHNGLFLGFGVNYPSLSRQVSWSLWWSVTFNNKEPINQSVHTATVMICQLSMSMYCVHILTESSRVWSRQNYKCSSTRVNNSQQVCVLEPWIIYILEKDLKIDCWISSRRTLVYSLYIHVRIDWLDSVLRRIGNISAM